MIELKRELRTRDLTLLAVVSVANLNVIPVIAANGGGVIWLWIAAILLFFVPEGIAVIELSRRLPGEGGVYVWAKRSFGGFHGFLCGWCYCASNLFFVPSALFYLGSIPAFLGGKGLADNRVFFFGFTVVVLWVAVLANVRGLGTGKWISNSGGIGTAVAGSLLIGLAVLEFGRHGWRFAPGLFQLSGSDGQIFSSFGVVCFALVGLELGPIMSEEIHDPGRTLPRSIALGSLVAGGLYIAVTLALLTAVPARELAILQGVLQSVATLAPALAAPVAVLLLFSIGGSVSAWVAGSARILFVSGIDRYLPPWLGRVHPRYATPYMALLLFGALSTVLIAMSFAGATVKEAYLTLLDLAVLLNMVAYLYLFGALLRIAFGSRQRGFFPLPALRFAAVSGLASTLVGSAVAFVPGRQILSVAAFEIKLVGTLAVFLAAGAGLYRYYDSASKAASAAGIVSPSRANQT